MSFARFSYITGVPPPQVICDESGLAFVSFFIRLRSSSTSYSVAFGCSSRRFRNMMFTDFEYQMLVQMLFTAVPLPNSIRVSRVALTQTIPFMFVHRQVSHQTSVQGGMFWNIFQLLAKCFLYNLLMKCSIVTCQSSGISVWLALRLIACRSPLCRNHCMLWLRPRHSARKRGPPSAAPPPARVPGRAVRRRAPGRVAKRLRQCPVGRSIAQAARSADAYRSFLADKERDDPLFEKEVVVLKHSQRSFFSTIIYHFKVSTEHTIMRNSLFQKSISDFALQYEAARAVGPAAPGRCSAGRSWTRTRWSRRRPSRCGRSSVPTVARCRREFRDFETGS